MLRQILGLDRLERARADVQHDFRPPHPARFKRGEQFGREVQAGRRCRDRTGLARKDVASVFDALGSLLAADLSKKGPGAVQVPGLMKVIVKRMPATKARKGINPFTGQETMFKAKPARNVVKIRALKALKDSV